MFYGILTMTKCVFASTNEVRQSVERRTTWPLGVMNYIIICSTLIARKLKQSRQAVHAQITLIREKVSRIQPKKASTQPSAEVPHNTASPTTHERKSPIPLRPSKK